MHMTLFCIPANCSTCSQLRVRISRASSVTDKTSPVYKRARFMLLTVCCCHYLYCSQSIQFRIIHMLFKSKAPSKYILRYFIAWVLFTTSEHRFIVGVNVLTVWLLRENHATAACIRPNACPWSSQCRHWKPLGTRKKPVMDLTVLLLIQRSSCHIQLFSWGGMGKYGLAEAEPSRSSGYPVIHVPYGGMSEWLNGILHTKTTALVQVSLLGQYPLKVGGSRCSWSNWHDSFLAVIFSTSLPIMFCMVVTW